METPRAIGKYEVLERIGKGGFGVVYKARDPIIQRLVAIKVCTSADETLRRRFLREAEIAGNLHHRNIVTVFELGHDEAGPFLVQEYLDGEDLDAKIRRAEPLPQDVRLGYLLQIARALEYAHRKGILHRDVKPSNVRVLHDDRIKILDFGIAKLSGAESQLTRSGRILGTAGYLAPEQIRGEAVDARSDVFSFGVLAYELLSYVHPFPGTTLSELLHQVVRSEPQPITSVYRDCPPEIAAVVIRCMEKRPARRYEGFSAVAEELASVLAGLRAVEAPRPREEDDEAGEGAPEAEPEPAPSPESTLARPVSMDAPPPPPEDDPSDLEATKEIPLEPEVAPARWQDLVRRLPVATAVLAACVLLALGAAWIGWRRGGAPEPAPAVGGADAGAVEVGVPATPGRLVVDAVPWGEVTRLVGADGGEVRLPPDRSTPLVLSLPPGGYTAEITHPAASEPVTCRAEVAAGDSALCTARVHPMEPLDYFREAGWWR